MKGRETALRQTTAFKTDVLPELSTSHWTELVLPADWSKNRPQCFLSNSIKTYSDTSALT
jgi:hypothetical protein